jgi:hypothetical protein
MNNESFWNDPEILEEENKTKPFLSNKPRFQKNELQLFIYWKNRYIWPRVIEWLFKKILASRKKCFYNV